MGSASKWGQRNGVRAVTKVEQPSAAAIFAVEGRADPFRERGNVVRSVTNAAQPSAVAIAAVTSRADPVRERLGERRPDCYGSDPNLRLASLIFPRFTLLSTRLRCEPLVGRVGLRTRGTCAAASTISCRRATASARLRSCVR